MNFILDVKTNSNFQRIISLLGSLQHSLVARGVEPVGKAGQDQVARDQLEIGAGQTGD